ncbi:AAA family ATPase [Brevibacterium sp. RIT 803]|uniref:AAA family ATPase n=1 Tax=Brevibacterium sp. RIT 803 TaxID=2810210 RepID=UPI00194F6261|nr:AAA family ATPase [Brevibacterium sp. RIT 803]MBM6588904.1 AAA family ATPase [Brevibacterium sp. RIT 803]
MAVYSDQDRQQIDEVCARWHERSLIGDASLLYPDEFPKAWSQPALDQLNKRFWENLIEGEEAGGKFESKWAVQLEGADIEVRLLAAECLLIYYLITASVGPDRKLEMINNTIGSDNQELHVATDSDVYEALKNWIANPGLYYNTRQDLHVGYLMELALRLKNMSFEDRSVLLGDDPWGFAEFAEGGEHQSDTMRHVVCHLLYPEYFERIASNTHKQLILRAFGELDSSGSDASQDQRLYSVRQSLKQRLPDWGEARRDYYEPDLKPIWHPSGGSGGGATRDPAFALDYKKQIVFYGPPGTGKTFTAGELAERVIRSAALQRWGVDEYFGDVDRVTEAVSDHVVRLQMHPSYGYAEFMMGLRLDAGGGTSYQPGALPRLVDGMRDEKQEKGERALPHVLILDEINRTDLSAMFGEAFSAMERDKRGVEMELFAEGDDGKPIRFSMPEDLYIIGTMNEIDQSVEALDFAMRRRFFWFPTPFDQEVLFTIWESQWAEQSMTVEWCDAIPQLEELAESISRLNNRIVELPDLGPEYELGAAVFGDLPYFVGLEWRYKTQGRRQAKILWNDRGHERDPLLSLWTLSIEPVLSQYLAGSDRRVEQLEELRQLLVTRSAR